MNNHSIPIQYDEPGASLGGAPLFNFVYCSQVRDGVGSADVDSIIATSRRRNRIQRITGVLVFGSGVFFQWIEGPKAEVMSLVKMIETDVRHEMMVTLSTDEEIRERVFPTWDMELVDAVTAVVSIPVVVSGGIGSISHVDQVLKSSGVSGLACASALHYGDITVEQFIMRN